MVVTQRKRSPTMNDVAELAGVSQTTVSFGINNTPNVRIPNGGYHCTQKLMRLPDPPTALFCFNDRMAVGAYDALRKMNLTIPDDVAVLGFDNQETIAAYLFPPLSTMELPHYQMGQWAGKYLIEHTGETGTANPLQHMIECPHINRASV